jgi:16S rRNA (uracil1498-N3)-methyltransferase
MALPVFYLKNNQTADFFTLSEETSRHIVQVLRMKEGEPLKLADGKGNLFTAIITDDHKKKCTVKVTAREFEEKGSKEVSVGISLLKNTNRFEWFLEKATEIGVTEVIPLLCDRTEKQHFRFDRMNNIVIAAMLQSQQAWLPLLREPLPFREVIANNSHATRLIAHCEEEQKEVITSHSSFASVQMLIGPEGDFSSEEISSAITPVTSLFHWEKQGCEPKLPEW